jgi:hypothetical protein
MIKNDRNGIVSSDMCLVVAWHNPTGCTKTRYVFNLRVIGYDYSSDSLRIYMYSSFHLSIHNIQCESSAENSIGNHFCHTFIFHIFPSVSLFLHAFISFLCKSTKLNYVFILQMVRFPTRSLHPCKYMKTIYICGNDVRTTTHTHIFYYKPYLIIKICMNYVISSRIP